MTLIAEGYVACFDLSLWRCLRCEYHEHKSIRIDGKAFWVGAMGRAIARECLRMTAEAWGSRLDQVDGCND
jgi:hypothetical protein